ncbi:MAG: hypothetical protein LIO51_01495 [Clostridiales bacterium]|nr:hypothetical protein [Clostridiales bacterium]
MSTFEKGDTLICLDTETEAAVVGTYKGRKMRNGQIAGQLAEMHCSQREDATKCEFYKQCKQRLKFFEQV